MTEQTKTTRLLSGGRVTIPQAWLDRNEIKEGDTLLFILPAKNRITISKAIVEPA